MRTAANICKGIFYPVLGAIGGGVIGVASSVVYIFGKIQLHLPGSIPQIRTVFNAQNFSIPSFLECVEAGRQCDIPVSAQIDMTSWSSPIIYASAVGAGVGLLGGGALFFSQCLRERRRSKYDRIFLPTDDTDDTINDLYQPQERRFDRLC